MEYEDKIELIEKLFAEDYKLTEEQAHKIINHFDLEDIMLERYEEEVKEAEEQLHEEWQSEMEYFPYTGDIHGGI